MIKYKEYQLMAFNLDWDALNGRKLYAFELSEALRKRLDDEFEKYIPSNSLQMALSAKFPEILSFNRLSNKVWFYSTEKLNVDIIREIFSDWLAIELDQLDADQINDYSMNEDPNSEILDMLNESAFKEIELNPNMTDSIYQCIPNYVALLLHYKILQIDSEPVRFHRIISDSPAELVSWPPINLKKPYSYHLQIRLHSVPQKKEKVIHIKLGIRRYANYDKIIKRSTLFGLKADRCTVLFAQKTCENFIFCEGHFEKSHDHSDPTPNWTNRPKDLFERLKFQSFPSPTDAIKKASLNPDSGKWITAVIYFTQMNLKGMPKPGTTASDKRSIIRCIGEIISPAGFILVKPLKRMNALNFNVKEGEFNEEVNVLPFDLRFYLRKDEPELKKLIIETSQKLKDFGSSLTKNIKFETPNIDLYQNLSPSDTLDRAQRLKSNFDKIFALNKPQIIYYDLPDAKGFLEKKDPRHLIRKVLLTYPWGIQQFNSSFLLLKKPERSEGEEKNSEQTINSIIHNIITGGMLNFGYNWKKWNFPYKLPADLSPDLIKNFRRTNEKLVNVIVKKHNMVWIGLYFTRIGAHFQVIAVKIDSEGNTFASLNNLTCFRPINEFHIQDRSLLLGSITKEMIVEKMFELFSAIKNDPSRIYNILINAKNEGIRNKLPFLQNDAEMDVIYSEYKEKRELKNKLNQVIRPNEIQNLNIIRIRTSESLETPDAFGVKPNEEGGQEGIFESMHLYEQLDPETELRVYYSIGSKSKMHKFARKMSRLNNSAQTVWNANVVELYLQFKSPLVNTLEILNLCHHLRILSPQFQERTRMPYPLVMAEELAEKIEDVQFDIQKLIEEE